MERYVLTTLVSMAMSACLLSSLMFPNLGENISTVIRCVFVFLQNVVNFILRAARQPDGPEFTVQRPASQVTRRCEWLFSILQLNDGLPTRPWCRR